MVFIVNTDQPRIICNLFVQQVNGPSREQITRFYNGV